MVKEDLIKSAVLARKNSYSPYSGFSVGAALLTCDGKIYTGCNIENAAFTPTNCAERTAFFKAVSEGEKSFKAIAICGGKGDKIQETFPCGVCRQVMAEFCDPETFEIIVIRSQTQADHYLLKNLFPKSFGPEDL